MANRHSTLHHHRSAGMPDNDEVKKLRAELLSDSEKMKLVLIHDTSSDDEPEVYAPPGLAAELFVFDRGEDEGTDRAHATLISHGEHPDYPDYQQI